MKSYNEITSGVWHNPKDGIILSLVNVTCQFGDTDDFYRVEKHNVKDMSVDDAYNYKLENDDYEYESFDRYKELKKYLKKSFGIKIDDSFKNKKEC